MSLLLIAACSSSEPVLISKSAAVPVGVDLSGQWLVRVDGDQESRRVRGGEEPFIISNRSQRAQRVQRARRSGGSKGPSVQVFLELGESVKITQTFFGLFISYDRSIVEEYSFGENRIVSIGPIEAKRVSGWNAESFVVETLDKSGTSLIETWHLESNGAVLVRDVQIRKEEDESFALQQIFDRKTGGDS